MKEMRKTIIVKLNPTTRQRRLLNNLVNLNRELRKRINRELNDYTSVFYDVPGRCPECKEMKYLEWEYCGNLICTNCLYKKHSGKFYDYRKILKDVGRKIIPYSSYVDEQVRVVFEAHKSYLQAKKSNKATKKPKEINPEIMELGKSPYFFENNDNMFINLKLDFNRRSEAVAVWKGENRQEKYIREFISRYAPKEEWFETKEEAKEYRDRLEKKKEKEAVGSIEVKEMKSRNGPCGENWRVRVTPTLVRCKLQRENREFYIHYPYRKKVEIPEPDGSFNPVAVDLNWSNNLAVISNTKKFYRSDIFNWLQSRAVIKSKKQGKRNYRKANFMGKKERKKIDYESKRVARWIIENAKKTEKPVVVIEKLKNIKERVMIAGKKDNVKRINRMNNFWFFNKIFENLKMMADWEEIPLKEVEAHYTSQQCSNCGTINKNNRKSKISVYRCKNCGYEVNDDLNATFNLRNRMKLKLESPEKYDELMKVLNNRKENSDVTEKNVVTQQPQAKAGGVPQPGYNIGTGES